MNDKMVRFLTSINLENIERFDMDFDLVARNKINREQVDMFIIKETPWTYPLLEEFINALESIKYPYFLRFGYTNRPTVKDAISLFDEWYFTHNRMRPTIKVQEFNEHLTFFFKNEEEQKANVQTMKDFKSFLDFICYSIPMFQQIGEPAPEVKHEDKVPEKMTEEEKAIVSEARESLSTSYQQMEKRNPRNQSWKDRVQYKRYEHLKDVNEFSGNIDVDGELYGIDKPKIIRSGQTMLLTGLGRDDIAINMKVLENDHMPSDFIEGLKNGMWVRILGHVGKDGFTGNLQIDCWAMTPIEGPALRTDEEEEKRVELHLHTKMSSMDGVGTAEKYIKLASNMGHKALALTDHGVVQGYPDAMHALKDMKKAGKPVPKILYGVEFYMVNDELPFALNPIEEKLDGATYVVFDLETTGLSTRYDKITEFAGTRIEKGQVVKTLDLLINPERKIPLKIQEKTHITDDMVRGKPTIEQSIDQILEFMKGAIIVSHNIEFDYGFINETLRKMGRGDFVMPAIDTLSLSHYLFPENNRHNLGALSRNLNLDIYDEETAHRADQDTKVLGDVWLAMLPKLLKDNHEMKHSDLAKLKTTKDMLKHMRPSHVIALAKNDAGIRDLFELVSLSHIDYLADVPKLPKRELIRLRKNLILGSACFNGDIFKTERTRSKEELIEAMKFYDYIEVQPLENYIWLVNRGECYDMDEIQKYVTDIVNVAAEIGKPVCATGDVHYADPEDKLYRDVYIEALGVGNKLHPLKIKDKYCEAPNQHYRSTREMLDAFAFLGEDKAKEIVVTNTNKIADSIDEIVPIKDILCKPEIENSDKMLTEACFNKAKELFGDPLPEDIVERLNKELNGINGNGYSVTYYIAHKIIETAANDGYMVGSRGSVGSSLAAHLYGITEVNPLAPHYRCPKCKHFEYSNDSKYFSGSDLPEKKCPVCGEPMVHDGQDIPFETFLGFHAEKVPDIDLNFPSDYQARAHNLTKEIFGENNVFRAGTIGTVADKTAFGYVRKYFAKKIELEEHISAEEADARAQAIPASKVAYIASHCIDVKRTTGQHPGGIVVLPKGRDINEFTPIQYPADDKEADWKTTHLDYHAGLEEELLKLDLLGHVDPLALRLMSLLTGVDVKKIPLNDPKVISLFTSPKELHLNGNYLKSPTGASGLPEYGTDTCSDILTKAKPKSFADVVAVAGLAHGTNVWQHNEEQLIRDGKMSLHDCIAARDDIMKYLISLGVPSNVAFDVMEKVRKGKKIPIEHVPVLKEHNVPDYYIEACNKIKYLYPKAHAVAYATMAVRVGYFKVYYPLEFYAVWFSARCKAFDIRAMLAGKDGIIARYEEINRKINNRTEKVSPKEKDIHTMLEIAIEMAERGYTFKNVDLYKSDAKDFIVDKESGALIPPFIVIDGLGDSAAESVVEARKNGEFKSKEDLLQRTKLNGTNVDDLTSIGALEGLGDTNQMSLFEFGLE